MATRAFGIWVSFTFGIADAIRGVSFADNSKYAGTGGLFRCLADGSVFPISVVNDDFCDCTDGTDEPGTSACAGHRGTLFYCPNEGSAASYLYASRVNDGICDCCDGSDEWLREEVACPNQCKEEGDVMRKEQGMREAERQRGLDIRQRLMESLIGERRNLQQDLVLYQTALVDLEAAESLAAAALESTRKDPLREHVPNSSDQRSDPAINHVALAADDASMGTSEEVVGAGVSEYAKWMEGSESSLGNTEADIVVTPKPSQAPSDKEESSSARRRRRSKNPFRLIWSQATEFVSGIARRVMRSPAERAIDRAKKAHDNALKRLEEQRRQIHDVEKRLKELTVDDDQLAYASLAGRCITNKFTEYNYEICFFKNAKQDSTPLGNWLRWESPGVALFTNGRRCPRGPPRSIRVTLRCGASEEIEDVSEPSRCAYEATIAHPAACSDVPLGADAGPRLPTEEL